jgi:pyruvate formate-lyase/glycerol dehydratase family glycyl radical enzyme
MNERVTKLKKRLAVQKYKICIERVKLITESLKKTEELPRIMRMSMAFANYLDHKTIFIEDGELIVGNVASKSMGLEAACPTWPAEELKELREFSEQGLDLSTEDEAELRKMEEYWMVRAETLNLRKSEFYDDNRLWPFVQAGILLPPWQKKDIGRGYGSAGGGWGNNGGFSAGRGLDTPDYALAISQGFNKILADAEKELEDLRYYDGDSVDKAHFLKALIISLSALNRIAIRFSEMAAEMAKKESNPARKKELEKISETCRHVPANPPRTFFEAMQFFWFIWVTIGGGTTAGGRFDQFMYPYYKKDRESGTTTDEEVLELLELLRVKVMEVNSIQGGKMQREKWAGMARWNNWVIGGVDENGKDATNELSYLILDAAMDCQTPHHTITVRVHEGTPDKLMKKSLELIRTGCGMPAFVGDKSYISYFTGQGVSLKDARDYALGGCLEGNIPGKSGATMAYGMYNSPLVLDIMMHNGIEPRTGKQLGPKTGDFSGFKSFDEVMEAFKKQMRHFMGMVAEEHNILLKSMSYLHASPVTSILFEDAIKVGKDICNRTMPFENGSCMNSVGMINVADSMAAIKKLVFDDKKYTMKQLKEALDANWQGNGYTEMRKEFLAAPKFGNGEPLVDNIARDLYKFWTDTIVTFKSAWGGTMKPAGVSITAHGPGGSLVGATPEGRYAGENLADGTVSPAQGRDTHGPTAIIRSVLTVDQTPFQSTLLNMKFHPSSLKTNDDLKKLSDLIRTYCDMGGKHVQFNVVGKDILVDAQKQPEKHRDLIVRVAGYSAYFVTLTNAIQKDIINRTELEIK